MPEVNRATSMEASDIDYEALLTERNEKIESLERSRIKQDEALALLRSEFGAVQIKHKEETYWLRLEINNLKCDKQATDERMAELYRDLREIDDLLDDEEDIPQCLDREYVLHLQSQLSKSVQTMGVLDNQMSMVKRSCDEVVKSMKEEISDVMDDKCRMEVELMNQLAVLNNEKVTAEDEYQESLRRKDERIKRLERRATDMKRSLDEKDAMLKDATRGGVGELLSQLDALNSDHRDYESRFRTQEESITRLEKKNADLEKRNAELQISLEEASALAASDNDRARKGDRRIPTESGEETKEVAAEAEELARVKERLAAHENLESELREKIAHITTSNESLLVELDRLKQETSDTVSQLEETNGELEEQLYNLQTEFDTLRREQEDESNEKLKSLEKERVQTVETLERVTNMWEKADESIQNLEDIIEKLNESKKKYGEESKEHEGAISTIETASLVHGQVKVSLLLVELKLRNQLMSLKNDKLRLSDLGGGRASVMAMNIGGDCDGSLAGGMPGAQDTAEMNEKMAEIQDEALEALAQVEVSLLQQISELGEDGIRERNDLHDELVRCTDFIDEIQKEHAGLEKKMQQLRKENSGLKRKLDDATTKKKALEKKSDSRAAEGAAKVAMSKELMEKLQKEIVMLVDKVKDRNESIFRLTAAVDEHKVRESALKKELKRLMKRVRAMEDDGRSINSRSSGPRRPPSARGEV